MTKYKCPECEKKELVKRVYTEERCSCGHTNHRVHKWASLRGKD
jgi:DNA-directed RNA polymerase subunit RPC12/RpoP